VPYARAVIAGTLIAAVVPVGLRWQRVRSKADHFSAEFPGPIHLEEGSTSGLGTTEYTATLDRRNYTVTVVTFPADATKEEPDQILDGIVDLKRRGATGEFTSKISWVQGNPARQVRYRTVHKGIPLLLVSTVVLTDRRIYTVQVAASEDPSPELVEPGLGGGKASLGWANSNGLFGVAVKGTALRTWGKTWGTESGVTYLGPEAEFAMFGRLSVGWLWRVGSSSGKTSMFAWGVGIGF
jgi:hypothetical protein